MASRSTRATLVAAALLLAAQSAAATDQFEPNNAFSQATPLTTRSPAQRHDLQANGGVADQDWFTIGTDAYRSYEALIRTEGSTQIVAVPLFERLQSDGVSLLQTSMPYQTGNIATAFVRHLRWETAATDNPQLLRVTGATDATASTQYVIDLRETTLFCPRYNNSGSQVTVLIVQMALDGDGQCGCSARFFSSVGTLLGTQTGNFNGLPQLDVWNTAAIGGLAGQAGSARVTHTCGYGNIKAKLVALEPATGFSFDTPCAVREQ